MSKGAAHAANQLVTFLRLEKQAAQDDCQALREQLHLLKTDNERLAREHKDKESEWETTRVSLVGQRDDAQKAAQESKEDASRYRKERDRARDEQVKLRAQVEKLTSDLEDSQTEVVLVQLQLSRVAQELATL